MPRVSNHPEVRVEESGKQLQFTDKDEQSKIDLIPGDKLYKEWISGTLPKCLITVSGQSSWVGKSVTSSGRTRKSSSKVNGNILLATSTRKCNNDLIIFLKK